MGNLDPSVSGIGTWKLWKASFERLPNDKGPEPVPGKASQC